MHEHDTNERRQLHSALVIGGTGFVGRHTVRELLVHGYDVTTISRDRNGFGFGEESPVDIVPARRYRLDEVVSLQFPVDPCDAVSEELLLCRSQRV
jgi:nucleoside-diphosphate-sugar epimerase